MYKFTLIFIALALSHGSYAANIVVEEKSLSQPKTQAAPTPNTKTTETQETGSTMQWQLYQQLQQLQQEVRDLRGQLEIQANIIERMKQDARNRYLDLDQRISELSNRSNVSDSAVTPSSTATTTTASETAATPVVSGVDDDKKAYFAAYQTFKTGGPNKAINPMRQFITTYPQSSFVPSAYYWLGEFYLAANPADVNNAKKSFQIVVDKYADTPKAVAALLKLASFADVDGKKSEAVRYMQRIIKDFPQSDEAKAARAYLSSQNIAAPDDKSKKANPTPPPAATDKKPVKKEEAKSKTTP